MRERYYEAEDGDASLNLRRKDSSSVSYSSLRLESARTACMVGRVAPNDRERRNETWMVRTAMNSSVNVVQTLFL